jgi:hypothetical protein
LQIEVPEVSQSEEGQRQKLRIIVDALGRILHEQGAGSSASQQQGGQPKWTAEMIHEKVHRPLYCDELNHFFKKLLISKN